MGNEPSLHIPYIYNYLGAPWKTQKRVRMLLDTWFTETTLGMPGDEDGGGMSAFVVFSMMGLYPVTPGVPIYSLASPVFDRVTIRLHNGKTLRIVCRDNSEDNKYIQSIRLNGQPLDRVWVRHADLVHGATLEMQMSNTPNTKLGSEPSSSLHPASISIRPKWTIQRRNHEPRPDTVRLGEAGSGTNRAFVGRREVLLWRTLVALVVAGRAVEPGIWRQTR